MSTNLPQVISETNLSHAWGRTLLHVLDNGDHHLSPLMISVTGFSDGLPIEDRAIRNALDTKLAEKEKKFSIKVTSQTIFPYKTWVRRGRLPLKEFSDWYLDDMFPRLQARGRHHNGRGTYFERMIRFRGSKLDKEKKRIFVEVNQLEHLIKIWRKARQQGTSPRQSALQTTIFDPPKDHTGAIRQVFPCLQQVGFAYHGDALAVNAFYPKQYIMDRAYGNYLGLCHLGHFMAREMGLELSRLNCFIGLPDKGENWTKTELRPLADLIRSRLPDQNAS